MEEAWKRLTTPNVFTKPRWPLVCCDKPMVIEEDTSAQCYECGKIIWPAVPCATREQYYANGGRRRTPYHRIKYFREWMMHILGHPTYVSEDEMQRIKADLFSRAELAKRERPTPQALKKTLKRLHLQKHIKGISYLLSSITGDPIPEVSEDTMRRAEWMFNQLDGKIPYYPDVIYEIFYKIDPNHPMLGWIPRK